MCMCKVRDAMCVVILSDARFSTVGIWMQNDRLHIKCKINHVCVRKTRYLPYKYRQNGYKYHFICFYWQCFENLPFYFNKKNGTKRGSTPRKVWHQSLRDYSGLHIKSKINHVSGHSVRCHANTDKMATNIILFTFSWQWFENLS